MTDLIIGIPLLIAVFFLYTWGLVLGWDWAARRGWPWPTQVVVAVLAMVWSPLLFVLRVLARWIGWQRHPRYVKVHEVEGGLWWDDLPPQRNMTVEELERMRRWYNDPYGARRIQAAEERLAREIERRYLYGDDSSSLP